jgi:hypothetical protein
MKKYTRLTNEQKSKIREFLLGKPIELALTFDPVDFPREIDIYVYYADANDRNPIKTFDNEPIIEGKFFRIVQFSNKVLASLYFGHDRYGILGEIKTVESVNLSNLNLKLEEYKEFLDDISSIVLSIEPDLQIEWDGMEYMASGPILI